MEKLRGLRFRRVPSVAVMSADQLAKLGHTLRRDALVRLARRRGRIQRLRDLSRAEFGFESLAGLLPAAAATDVSAGGSSEQIGGAYDYRHNRVVLVDRVAQSRREVQLIIAHEMTHALEDQHFALHIVTSRGPAQTAQARRALIEGTATLVAALYDGRYLHNRLPVSLRIAGQRSVFAAGGSTPFAVKASTIFDYVDGPLFVFRLYRRAGGAWPLVNGAIRNPPSSTGEILHPASWPAGGSSTPVRLGLRPLLARGWRLAGGGLAGEEDVRAILSAGAPTQLTADAAAGVRGGRFELWRARSGRCAGACAAEDVGVIGFRLHRRADIAQVRDGFFDYALLGRLAEQIGSRTWRLPEGGYAALGASRMAAAFAFAPRPRLARGAALRAAGVVARSH